MKSVIEINRTFVSAALLLAVAVVASAAPGTATPGADAKSRAQSRCVVDGKKLDKAGKPFVLAYAGQGIQLCSQECAPKFEKNASRYLKKLQRAEQKVAKAEQPVNLPPALDDSPGGLAWPGW